MQVPTAAEPARTAPALQGLRLVLLALLFSLLAGCAGVKLVVDYDADAAKTITDTSAEVFTFYDKLIEAKTKALQAAQAPKAAGGPQVAQDAAAQLPYAAFAEDWGKIETRIRVLVVREESRPLNSESQRISRTILEFWQKYRARHQQSDDYGTVLAVIHRDRYQRLFTAALVAEKAKSLANDDSDAKKE